MRQEETEYLITSILQGKTEGYGQLLASYGESILNFVGMLVPSVEDAQELTQDSFVLAFQHLNEYDSARASFYTWLRQIAYHEVCHFRRKQKWKPQLLQEEWMSDDVDLPKGQLVSEAELDALMNDTNEERLKYLDECVDELPPDKQMLLQLFYYEDVPLKDIAFILETKPENVANQLSRLRQKLYKMIKDKEHGKRSSHQTGHEETGRALA